MLANVIKLGGGAGVEYAAALADLAGRIKKGEKWVIVHGCSDATNRLMEQVGYPPQTIISPGGHSSRYTDARTIELFSMAAAAVNQQISAELLRHGLSVIGLSGPTLIMAERKKAIRAIREGKQIIIRDDFSGKITGLHATPLLSLLEAGVTPVIAPLAIGTEYERLNVDGDLAAATIARALSAENLIILTNVPGLLRDVKDTGSLVSTFKLSNLDQYEALAEGRMKKKLMAAQNAKARQTILASAAGEHPIAAALGGGSTHILGD